MSDVLIINRPEGSVEFGVEIVNGQMTMTDTFDSAVKLSLWGGNQLDDGSAQSDEGWWGNLLENQPERKMISKTQNLLRALPLTSSSLRQIEEAVAADLAWFVSSGIASSVENIRATIPAVDRVKIDGDVNAVGTEASFHFTENWKAGVGAASVPAGITSPSVPTPVTGKSIVFDNTNSIEGAADADLEIGNVFTIMAWIRTDFSANQQVFTLREFAGGFVDRVVIRVRDVAEDVMGRVVVQLSSAAEQNFKNWEWQDSVPYDEWTHVVATWDGTAIEVYVNGESVPVTAKTEDNIDSLGTATRVIKLAPDETFTGTYHQAAIWSTLLSPTEIQRIYNGGKTGVDLSVDNVLYESSATCKHWYQPGLNPTGIGDDYGNGTPRDLTVLTNIDAGDIVDDAPGVE